MNHHGKAGIVTVAATVILSACAPQPEVAEPTAEMQVREPAPEMDVGPCKGDLDEWALVIDGVPIDDLLAQPGEARLEEYLQSWGIDVDDRLQEQIARIKQGEAREDDVHEALTGIGGFAKIQVAEIALASRDPERAEETRLICGKIRDYVYDEGQKSGHLAVDTRIDVFDTAASYNAGTPDSVERYHWDIEVDGIYRVIQRDDNNPADPFPNTVKLPDAAKDPANPDGIWQRGLDHKLYAKGTGIKVRHVYQRFDDGRIERLPAGHPYYVSTDESCIDLLTAGPPPATVGELPPQSGYCLGRCDHPQVVNTR